MSFPWKPILAARTTACYFRKKSILCFLPAIKTFSFVLQLQRHPPPLLHHAGLWHRQVTLPIGVVIPKSIWWTWTLFMEVREDAMQLLCASAQMNDSHLNLINKNKTVN